MADDSIKTMVHETDSLRIEATSLHQKYDDLVALGKPVGNIPDRIYDILLHMNDNADMIEEHANTLKGAEKKKLLEYVEDIRDFLDETVIIEDDKPMAKKEMRHCKECGRLFEGDSLFCSRMCESKFYDVSDEDS